MEIIRTSFDIPKALHKAFKKRCVALDKDMKDVLQEIMNKWLMQEQNKEVGEEWKKPSLKN